MLYSSINNAKVKDLKKLQTKKYRDETGLFLIEGYHLVTEALQAGVLKEVYVLENSDYQIKAKLNYVSPKVMNYLKETEASQNIIGVCFKKKSNQLSDHLLVLDNIQDPGNLGTIIRSAVAFNFKTILLSANTVDLYNAKVIRASQGMLFKVNLIYDDLRKAIPLLKDQAYQIIGTDVKEGQTLDQITLTNKYAVIMGNEGNGIDTDIKNLCDNFIYLKMQPNCESLNVGVAASIIMYEMSK